MDFQNDYKYVDTAGLKVFLDKLKSDVIPVEATADEVNDILFTTHTSLTSDAGVFTLGSVVADNEYVIVKGVSE